MKAILNNLLLLCLLFPAWALPVACSDWTEPETVDLSVRDAKEQNPELWARYMEVLRAYKQSKHFLTYTRFSNGAEKPLSEGDFLRSLPDSLDIVSLGNSGNITAYDREDIPLLREKSTRVLYLVDYAARDTVLTDAAKLGAWLDKAVATAAELNLDGFAFTGTPLYAGTEAALAARKEAARLIVSRLSAASQGKLLVFEGDPAFVEAAGLEKLSYVVLNTEKVANITDLKLKVAGVLASGVTKEKLLLSAGIGSQIADEANVKRDAVPHLTDRVASLGPLAGLAICAIGDDYYNAKMNYETTRTAIQLMNPSK